LAVLLVTKEPACFSQYREYFIGWTALILISCERQDNVFISKHPAHFWWAPQHLFNESQQYCFQYVKLTTCLYRVSGSRMSALTVLLHLHDSILCTGTALHYLHITEPPAHCTIWQRSVYESYISREKQQLSVTAFYQFQLSLKS